jgi:hypothetical protein
MSRAEAHSWWDDVQHLKPDASKPPAVSLVDDAPSLREAAEGNAARRRARVCEEAEAGPRLSREDAAGFADAFDLDGAFGAPRKRFAREPRVQDTEEGRVIVLARDPEPELAPEPPPAPEPVAEAEEPVSIEDELLGDLPERDPETGRRVVRITGRPETQVAPRRLREIEPRRARRTVADRALSSPDRMALYAVLLGLFLVVLAAASAGPQP